MANKPDEASFFTGFGVGRFSGAHAEGSVFILVVSRDGNLTAAAHATERGAMEAAVDYLSEVRDDDEESGALEDQFARAQQIITEEGGVMEIIASPVFGS